MKISRLLSERHAGGRFVYLLGVLLLLLILHPYIDDEGPGLTIGSVLFFAIPITGIYACAAGRRVMIVALILGLPALAGALYNATGIRILPGQLAPLSSTLFYAYTTIIILRSILSSESVTVDTIFGAICVYLLLGITFAEFYTILELAQPGSFSVASVGASIETFERFIYFSFVTLTTLGYGDIAPVTGPARSLCILEAVIGVMFLATTIARLVGVHASGNPNREGAG
jgi:hypothetical protein